MTPDYEEQIEDICNNMNWFKIHTAMKTLSWKWYMGNGISRVPDESELEETARDLLLDITIHEGDSNHSTGGFEARKESGILTLRFAIEKWPY